MTTMPFSTLHAEGARLSVAMASDETDILDAQRLRYKVFHDEMGARLASGESGFDQDMFDPFCEHLVVRNEDTRRVIGTYRLLTPDQAAKAGGYYSETEFDITRLAPILPRTIEAGRSCVHPDHRNGAVIGLLWSGLIGFMKQRGFDYAMGCASMKVTDGGHAAASVFTKLAEHHLSPEAWRVQPFNPLPLESLRRDVEAVPPPLLKGYLRLGAWICGEPAWDPDFNTADLFILFPLARMNPRYARHLLRG